MTSCDTIEIPCYSPTVDINPLLRSWYSPGRIDKITMAHIHLDMIAVDGLVQPRLDRIKQLESEIARLRVEIDNISPTLDKYHSFHAPIRRLPPDVLLSVFGHIEPSPMPDKRATPWVLTEVCASWRELVMNTPMLWSTIRMDCPDSWDRYWNLRGGPGSSYPLPLLSASLRYSTNTPLDIILISGKQTTFIDHITVLLRQHSTRWRSLVADSDEFIPNYLPVLEKLELPVFSTVIASLQAPRLHTLSIGRLYNIPFSMFPSLRHLECAIIDPTQLITLLEDAKQLTSLQVDYQGFAHINSPSADITSNLLELHLSTKVPETLAYISFPVLYSLTLGLPSIYGPRYTPSDVDILNNLHCPRLRTLIFHHSVNVLPLARLLSCPINRLDLVVGSEIVYHALNSIPLPHLEDLRITDMSGPWESLEMVRTVKAKKNLRNVEIKSASSERTKEMFGNARFREGRTMSFSDR